MASRRTLKAAEAIREVVAMSLLTDLKDPRVEGATITRVEVSGDMRQAKVYFMTREGEVKERLIAQGLKSAAGFLQQKVARRIESRYIPTLDFEVDEGMKNLMAVTQILADQKRERQGAELVEEDDEFESDDDEEEEEEDDGEDDAPADGDA